MTTIEAPEVAYVQDRDYRQALVHPGVLDYYSDYAYSNGQCHALALAVHEETGWPIVTAMMAKPKNRALLTIAELWNHSLIRTPKRLLLDIRGENDKTYVLERSGYLITLKPEVTKKLLTEIIPTTDNGAIPNIEVARSFVDPVLKRAGYR